MPRGGRLDDRVTKPIRITRHTSALILMFVSTVGSPVRTSELRKAVTNISPESATPIYGCLGDLMAAGLVGRLSVERDALLTIEGK
jgi:hypothetical protein